MKPDPRITQIAHQIAAMEQASKLHPHDWLVLRQLVAAVEAGTPREKTAEQKARDMLDRMGIDDAQRFTAGDVVELANLISDYEDLKERAVVQGGGPDVNDEVQGLGGHTYRVCCYCRYEIHHCQCVRPPV